MALRFVDPPESNQGRAGKHSQIAEELKARPNEWAIIDEDGHAPLVTYIKSAKGRAYAPAGSFTATSRRKADGKKYTIYAKYIGNKKKD